MKLKTTIALISLFIGVGSSQAATILVDYDDGVVGGGHDASVRGGDFDTENAGGWVYTLGTGVAEWKDNNTSGIGSIGNLTIGSSNNDPTGPKVPGVDTGATIESGDTFDISFMWRDALGWDDDVDTVSLALFYTDDNLLTGTATDIVTLVSGISVSNNSYQLESGSGLSFVDAGATGKKLFVRINTTADEGEFARLDNVYIAVTSIPEPSSSVLLSLGGLSLILRRKK